MRAARQMAGSHVTAAVQLQRMQPRQPGLGSALSGDPAVGWLRWGGRGCRETPPPTHTPPTPRQRVLPNGPLGLPQSSRQNRKADYWVQIAPGIRWGQGMAPSLPPRVAPPGALTAGSCSTLGGTEGPPARPLFLWHSRWSPPRAADMAEKNPRPEKRGPPTGVRTPQGEPGPPHRSGVQGCRWAGKGRGGADGLGGCWGRGGGGCADGLGGTPGVQISRGGGGRAVQMGRERGGGLRPEKPINNLGTAEDDTGRGSMCCPPHVAVFLRSGAAPGGRGGGEGGVGAGWNGCGPPHPTRQTRSRGGGAEDHREVRSPLYPAIPVLGVLRKPGGEGAAPHVGRVPVPPPTKPRSTEGGGGGARHMPQSIRGEREMMDRR